MRGYLIHFLIMKSDSDRRMFEELCALVAECEDGWEDEPAREKVLAYIRNLHRNTQQRPEVGEQLTQADGTDAASLGEPGVMLAQKYRPVSDSDWLNEYEHALSEVVRDHARCDSEIALFVSEVLKGKQFETADLAKEWIEKEAGLGEADSDPIMKFTRELFPDYRRKQFIMLPAALFPDDSGSEPISMQIPHEPVAELKRLKDLSMKIARAYDWPESWSTAFILTGRAPMTPAYFVRTEQNGKLPCLKRIVLEIDPVLPPKEVTRIYSMEREKLKPRWHKLSVKMLQMAAHAARNSHQSWRQRFELWVDPHSYRRAVAELAKKKMGQPLRPEFQDADLSVGFKEGEYHRFRRDASRARQRLLDPEWRPKSRADQDRSPRVRRTDLRGRPLPSRTSRPEGADN